MYANLKKKMSGTKLQYYAPGVKRAVPSRGLGDTIEKVTKATGIKFVVDKISETLNTDCGCSERKQKLNEIFPYKK